jgi:RNA polymerase sigma-70 factor (ECF subfamily)
VAARLAARIMVIGVDQRRLVFDRFVEEHLDQLYSAAYRYARNPVDAEDLTQETLMRAWAHLDPSRSQPELRAWIWKILANLWLDRGRRRAALDLLPTDPGELPEQDPSPASDHEALRHLTRSEVREAIDALPEHYRLPVMLADIDGFSYDEIAGQLEIRVGTVTSRIRRGRLALRRALWRSAAVDGIETDVVCREAASLLAEYCRGETSPAETRFVETHLQGCLRCQDAEHTERQLVDALRDYSCHLRVPAPLRDFARRVSGSQ